MATYRAELEEAHFRAKMFDALADDARLDALEASLNAQPDDHLWGVPASDANAPPQTMDDEEYAEWVRRGMWRRTHRDEVEAEERRVKEKEERKERERLAHRTIERAEKEKEARRAERKAEREQEKRAGAWASYRALWDALNSAAAAASVVSDDHVSAAKLTFRDVPWPVYPSPVDVEPLTKDAIASFLLATDHSALKTRKQCLREALLSYHPDRFVGRYVGLIRLSERALVQEGIGRVIRALNTLTEEDAGD